MELKEYLLPLRKWWWLLLASTLLATITSIYTTSQQPSVYRAKSSVLIGRAIDNPNPTGNEFWLGQQLAQTYVAIGQRAQVRQATQAQLGMTWLPQYEVSTVPNTLLIEITVNDTVPERAAAVANTLANQLILQSPNSGNDDDLSRQTFINSQLNDLEGQIEATNLEIQEKQDELGQIFSARQIADTQNQIAALETKLNTLQSNYASLLANTQQGAINQLSIMETATVPATPIGLNSAITILTAAAIGFVLAAGAAYLLEYLDDTVKSAEELVKVGSVPVLASISRIKQSGSSGQSMLVPLHHPRSPITETYRTLRTGIQFSMIDQAKQSILVTSASPAEGKSVTSANTAIVMAQAGKKVLLVDSDLRRPKQHNLFNLNNDLGLTTLLIRLESDSDSYIKHQLINDVVQSTPEKNLSVITCGPLPPNPSELLGSSKMNAITEEFKNLYDVVIFDTPPALAVTDAIVLSARVDGVLIVAQSNSTRRGAVKTIVNRLTEVNANILGCVLNQVPVGQQDYYYYYGSAETDSPNDDGGSGTQKRKRTLALRDRS